jgi:hypothetical protein
MHWLGAVMASAADKGDIVEDEKAKKKGLGIRQKSRCPLINLR